MDNNLIPVLENQPILLTANQRLARFLQSEFEKLSQEKTDTTTILPLQNWLESYWQQHRAPSFTLLSSAQEQFLWETIIRASPQGKLLLQLSATAHAARQAWKICQHWNIDYTLPIFQQTEDTQAWQTWAQTFENLCTENHWLEQARLLSWVTQHIQQQPTSVTSSFNWVGFLELNPSEKKLWEVLKSTFLEPSFTATEKIFSLALTDMQAEIRTLANWAYHHWKENPDQKIACLVPHLTEIRTEVYEVFCDVFAPLHFLPGKMKILPFNVAGGERSCDFPLIHAALTLLDLDSIASLSDVSQLLSSVYVGSYLSEKYLRAQLDVVLRNGGEPSIPLRKVLLEAKKIKCHHFAKQLEDYLNSQAKIPDYLSPNDWAHFFTNVLRTWGWPGERTLNSVEYQLTQHWAELLHEFTTLNPFNTVIDRKTAIQQLKQLAARTPFQPQTPITNIQILDPLETVGITFDRLWIMGLHDNVWPPPPKPNPFIPIALQRKHHLPHADHTRELYFSRLLTQRLCSSTSEIIFSYPEQNDEQVLRKSPLIHFAKEITLSDLNLTLQPTIAEIIFNHRRIEMFEDWQAPALLTKKIFGGHAVLQQQAACPFRAFARFRLGAQAFITPQSGLDPRERGNLLHAVLETCWNIIQTQENLLNYTEQPLERLVNQSIDKALLQFIEKKPSTFKQRFTELEKIRLQKLLIQWLNLEKKRATFKVISTEKKQMIDFANLSFNLRLDRMDQLADGNYLIVDYKTGTVNQNNWLDHRPDEPQLPLYAVTSELPIHGVALAQLRSQQMKFTGLSAKITGTDGIVPLDKIKELPNDWPTILQHWREVLTHLADEFRSGHAKRDPKMQMHTCRHCDFPLLCRIKEVS